MPIVNPFFRRPAAAVICKLDLRSRRRCLTALGVRGVTAEIGEDRQASADQVRRSSGPSRERRQMLLAVKTDDPHFALSLGSRRHVGGEEGIGEWSRTPLLEAALALLAGADRDHGIALDARLKRSRAHRSRAAPVTRGAVARAQEHVAPSRIAAHRPHSARPRATRSTTTSSRPRPRYQATQGPILG